MEEILKRLRQLRAYTGLKQAEFSQRIGMAGNSYSQIETGVNPLKDRHIALICLTFDVNETWLRTGQGEMFVKKPKLDHIEPIIGPDGEPLKDDEAELIWIFRELLPENKKFVQNHLDMMLTTQKNTKKALEKPSNEAENKESAESHTIHSQKRA